MKVSQVIEQLHRLANPEKVAFKKAKYNIVTTNALGIYMKDLNLLAKEIGNDKPLALALFDTGLYDAQILCSKILKPKDVTPALMEQWLPTFENWEICDSFSMGLFSKTSFAQSKIVEWSRREREFEIRAAFATLASYTMADKKAANEIYESFYSLIIKAATDDRIYVKKAVNWALRSIGKRNSDLRKSAIATAIKISEIDHAAAKWIAKDALNELQSEKLKPLDYPRSIYRL
ncbi:hypothetical protein ULMA_29950 [Patiriisocius marinus]|uniref:DNA alkylation repair protein n=1 Tax=Patiriisocius marinus TaxID=1397112 RepID=A0A5J4J8L3_9FLAO|nr:DNA alkylation repair protein [Patiriisocius marinus]GER60887.1 hypothetical protein ULMA_29950 [Patiriisocius marinus]